MGSQLREQSRAEAAILECALLHRSRGWAVLNKIAALRGHLRRDEPGFAFG